ncbi:MAG: tetratricopeptide repeat protein [candidate division WOR-3 bacterium]
MLKQICLSLCIVLVGFSFSQQVSGDSLLKMLEKAKLFYNNGEYENAIKQLEDALQYLKQLNQSEQVEAYKYLAFSYVAFGDKERAKEQFKKALLLDPKLELDPATVSPKIIKVFEEAKAEMATVTPKPPPVQPPPTKPTKPVVQPAEVSATGALMRSCCLPGWGQMYKGESSKGKKLMIATAVLLPTAVISTTIQEKKHQKYLDIEPGNEDEMDQAYREYKLWYNITAFSWLTFAGLYFYNLYDVIFTKPATKSSMINFDNGFYCNLTNDYLQFGYKKGIK